MPCRHGCSAALRAVILPAKRASSARTGFALGRCLGLPSPWAPSSPAEARSVTPAAPDRRARNHRFTTHPRSTARQRHRQQVLAAGYRSVPLAHPRPREAATRTSRRSSESGVELDGSPQSSRRVVTMSRSASDSVQSAPPLRSYSAPSRRRPAFRSRAVRHIAPAKQPDSRGAASRHADMCAVHRARVPVASETCPGVGHHSQAMDVSIFDEKPDGLAPTTSGSGPMR